jgi:UDP-glucose 4,6-dehydratase
VQGSIASSDLVNYIMRKEKIDYVLHFAAQTHVDNSFGNSIAFTESNVLGTHVLLEAAKEAKVKLFIHVSTDEVYGDGISGVASTESSILEPTNPYSASKAGAEYLVKAYHRSFDLPTIITRGNNVYGPHQYPEKIVPKFVNQLIRNLPITLHGSGTNTRNYLYVEDVARAFDIVLHHGKIGETYNIGGTNVHTNIDVARSILTNRGFVDKAGTLEEAEKRHIVYVPDRPFNDLGYPLDCSRLAALGWKEEVPFDDGLRATIQWYLKHTTHWNFADVESALVPHPRRGYMPREVLEGIHPEGDTDLITRMILERSAPSGGWSEPAAVAPSSATTAGETGGNEPSTTL